MIKMDVFYVLPGDLDLLADIMRVCYATLIGTGIFYFGKAIRAALRR